jgi:Zn-dependent M16 (insulinase) family peptidase
MLANMTMEDKELREAILALVRSHQSWQSQAWIAFESQEKTIHDLSDSDGIRVRELLERAKEDVTEAAILSAESLARKLVEDLQSGQPYLAHLQSYSRAGR